MKLIGELYIVLRLVMCFLMISDSFFTFDLTEKNVSTVE